MTTRSRWRHWLVPLLALTLVAAACGDDDSDAGGGPVDTSTPAATATGDGGPDADGPDGDEPDGDEPGPTAAEPGTPDRDDQPDVEVSECPVAALEGAATPVEVTFWHAMTAINGEVLEDLVDEYNASQDLVVVRALFEGAYEDSFAKYLNTLRSGGDLPDVIQLNETMLQQMVDSRSIVPIQACLDADGYDSADLAPGLLDQYRIGDVVITMPFQLSNPVLYYDGVDFEAAGLDPAAAPVTLDDVLEVSRTLVQAGVVEQGIALEIDAWIFEQWVNMAGQELVDNENGRAARAENPLLDSAAVTDVYEFLATLRDEGLVINTGRGTDQAAIDKYLAVGFNNAAMTIGTSANLGEIYNQIENFPDVDLRVAPLPGPTGGKTAIGGGSLFLVADTSDEVRAAVWDFMKWLNEPAQQIAWSAGTGYIPTRQSAIGDPELDTLWAERPGFRVAYDQLASPGSLPGGGGPIIGDHLGFREAIEQSLEALYQGADPATTQARAQEEAAGAIADYNRRIG